MIKAIIFDFDNTVEDFKKAEDYAYPRIAKHMFLKYGLYGPTTVKLIEEVDHHFCHLSHGKSTKYFDRKLWAKELFKRAGVKATKKDLQEFEDFYWRFIIEGAKPMPYAVSVLKRLGNKYKIIIMSNSDGKKRYKIERVKTVGLYDVADMVTTGDDVNQNKPSRKLYARVLNKFKLKPSECVMVGDTPEWDLEIAKKIGMKTVWMRYGTSVKRLGRRKPSSADKLIDSLRELPKVVDSFNRG